MRRIDWTIQDLKAAAALVYSWTSLCLELGYRNPDSRCRAYVRSECDRNGIDTSHFKRRGTRSFSPEKLAEAVHGSRSWSQLTDTLGLAKSGTRYKVLRNACQELGIEHSHLDGWYATLPPRVTIRPIQEYLVRGSSISSGALRKRLIKEGLKEERCEMTGCPVDGPTWLGRPITLHLDHVDGDHSNNELSNLRILCPNCHTQTPTHGAKRRHKVDLTKRSRKRSKGSKYGSSKCLDCGTRATGKRCRACDSAVRERPTKIQWPPLEELVAMVEATSYSAVGRDLGVSDNAVRKHIRNRT